LRQKYLDLEPGCAVVVSFTVSSFTITYKSHYYPHTIPVLSTSGFSVHETAKADIIAELVQTGSLLQAFRSIIT